MLGKDIAPGAGKVQGHSRVTAAPARRLRFLRRYFEIQR